MNEGKLRLFFALWPDPSTSAALTSLAREIAIESGGRPTAPGNAHLTLAFLGDQPRRVARDLSAAAAGISTPAFELVFDRVDAWRRSGIVWAGVRSVPAPLLELHQAVKRSLIASSLEPDDRPFAAHVTLARHAETSLRRSLAPPLVWHVAAFALVASELSAEGARYRVLSSWPLMAQT